MRREVGRQELRGVAGCSATPAIKGAPGPAGQGSANADLVNPAHASKGQNCQPRIGHMRVL
jgi:hypothetical protein